MTQSSAWFVQLPRFFCLVATGNDRKKFLHNFCTNEIRELPNGQAAEAFFVDVRARVLGHGWVLAKPEHHEIWGIPGDHAALLKHLNKYLITEDVQFRDASSERLFFAVSDGAVSSDADEARGFSADVTVLPIQWAGCSMQICSVPLDQTQDFRTMLMAAGIREEIVSKLDCLRIAERWPIVGTDISNDHLAPEAERNSTAISYRKGCYLGQEPIARLDAMGHVNKALRCLLIDAATDGLINAEIRKADVGPIGTITSAAPLNETQSVALAMVKTHGIDLTSGVTVQLSSGVAADASVQRPDEFPPI